MIAMKMRTVVRISLILLATVVALATAAAGADYKVVKTWKLGGDGGWDYLTADSDGHRLFIARATRVMVIDTESGKQVGEIPETTGNRARIHQQRPRRYGERLRSQVACGRQENQGRQRSRRDSV
jgi:hypothetical protein